jgi:hypothetical protein
MSDVGFQAVTSNRFLGLLIAIQLTGADAGRTAVSAHPKDAVVEPFSLTALSTVDEHGHSEIDPSDSQLAETVDGLRLAVEADYGQHIAFVGEPGPPSAIWSLARPRPKRLKATWPGFGMRDVVSGTVRGTVQVRTVAPGIAAIGVDLDTAALQPQQPGR